MNAPDTTHDAVVAERGDDVINISGRVIINGNVLGGRGGDQITVTGGMVNGCVSVKAHPVPRGPALLTPTQLC